MMYDRNIELSFVELFHSFRTPSQSLLVSVVASVRMTEEVEEVEKVFAVDDIIDDTFAEDFCLLLFSSSTRHEKSNMVTVDAVPETEDCARSITIP